MPYALDRSCPIFEDEFEIQKIRVTERITMREARRKRRLQIPLSVLILNQNQPTFANIMQSTANKNKTKNIGSSHPTSTNTFSVPAYQLTQQENIQDTATTHEEASTSSRNTS